MTTEYQKNCSDPACGCGTPADEMMRLERRYFIKSLGAGALALGSLRAMAGPFTQCDFDALVPVDKKLSTAWIRSLYERGTPEIWSGEELKFVGMPVGGICCGQLYLGGDGRLWLWDIFKCQYIREPDHGQRLERMTICGHYMNPPTPETAVTRDNGAHVEQGFVLRVARKGTAVTRFLDRRGFTPEHISFRGEYPVGRVTYHDPEFPVRAKLEAFSPFIPLRAEDSGIPATILSWELTNNSGDEAEIRLGGYLENAVCPYDHDPKIGYRRTSVLRGDKTVILMHEARPAADQSLDTLHGHGSMALGLLDAPATAKSHPAAAVATAYTTDDLLQPAGRGEAETPFDRRPLGVVDTGSVVLAPGETKVFRFVLGWFFPDYRKVVKGEMARVTDFSNLRRHYANRYSSAAEVVRGIAARWEELAGHTRKWNRTWNDSTLPHWLLDRAFIGMDCLATQTAHWFSNGRFWGWEGVDCCPGTCTHVWQYAQGMARIFPELERDTRQRVDFDLGFSRATGVIRHRAENSTKPAADGQAGTILRVLREHRMTTDQTFLASVWPAVKSAFGYLESLDTNGDNLLDAPQAHTLDAEWAGEIAWITSLYLAAAQACVEMAREMNDEAFARHCEAIVTRGRKELVARLFNGEYFIHKPDPTKPKLLNTNDGCHIDQVLGQSLAFQVGLAERIVPKAETESALRSLWKYNFTPDAGGYALKHREIGQAFRWYAMPGEAGLLMTTWPKGGAEKAIPGVPRRSQENPPVWTGPGGYFNECMNGFEYQAASHMIYEGDPGSDLVEMGLAVTKAVHERYNARSRNPYNEIECSDHYSRSMAGYGVFLALCGFYYDGPRGHIGFSPRVRPEAFKAPFTAADGWGTYVQHRDEQTQKMQITLAHGRLALRSFTCQLPHGMEPHRTSVVLGPQWPQHMLQRDGDQYTIRLGEEVVLVEGDTLEVEIEC